LYMTWWLVGWSSKLLVPDRTAKNRDLWGTNAADAKNWDHHQIQR